VIAPPRQPAAHHTAPSQSQPPGPDPARLAGLLTRTWLEIRAGRRPLAQLAPLVTPAVRRRLAADLRRRRARATSGPPRVRRVVAATPAAGVCEAVVLVEHDGRTTAVAVRLERRRGRWRAVDLTAPEDGLPALQAPPVVREDPRDAFDLAEAEELARRAGSG
jgi:hypothetical protein